MATESLTTNEDERRPPQFSLRSLFWVMAAVSALCAAMTAVGMVWSLLLLMVVALIVAHVVGNALGTRLRDEATRRIDRSRERGGPRPLRAPLPVMSAPPLRENRPLGQAMFVFVGAGSVAGALLGRFIFHYAQRQPLAPADTAIAIISCAVLGAIAGFMASSFFKVAVWPAVKFFFSSGRG